MKRICICVSGQMRGPDDALVSLKKAIGNLDVTVIFSVWDRLGGKLDGSMNRDQLPRMFEPAICSAIPQKWLGHDVFWTQLPVLYQERAAEIEAMDSGEDMRQRILLYFPHAVIDIEPANLLSLSFDTVKEDRNSVRMLYKIWRANEIKRQLEKAHGMFDCVIRMRPDLIVREVDVTLLEFAASNHQILVNGFVPGGGFVGDSFAAGSSTDIDTYCRLFGRAVLDPDGWKFIHYEIHNHLSSHGIVYQRYPHSGDLVGEKIMPIKQVIGSMETMLEQRLAWSDAHSLSLSAFRGAQWLASGLPHNALQCMADTAVQTEWQAGDLDGFLTVLATTMHRLGRPLEALACLLTTLHMRGQQAAHCHDEQLAIMVGGFTCPAVAEILANRQPFGATIDSALADNWLNPVLTQATDGQLHFVLDRQADTALTNPLLCRLLINRLLEEKRLTVILLIPQLLRFPGAESDPELQLVHYQLLLAVGQKVEALVPLRRLAQLEPDKRDHKRLLATLTSQCGLIAESNAWAALVESA
jgi:hypothetical protein